MTCLMVWLHAADASGGSPRECLSRFKLLVESVDSDDD